MLISAHGYKCTCNTPVSAFIVLLLSVKYIINLALYGGWAFMFAKHAACENIVTIDFLLTVCI